MTAATSPPGSEAAARGHCCPRIVLGLPAAFPAEAVMVSIYIDTNVFLDFCQSATDRMGIFQELRARVDCIVVPELTVAAATGLPATVYRFMRPAEAGEDDQFLYVRRIDRDDNSEAPTFRWGVVDTREAAQMLRDVSDGPTPYFGAVAVETVGP